MKFRITYELDNDNVDSIELAESRALAIANAVGYETDMVLKILNVEVCETKDRVLSYSKGILELPEIDDETRKKIIKQISECDNSIPIVQLPETVSKTYTVQDMEQEGEKLILVRWDEIDCGEYYGETQFCKSWEEAVDYMVKTGKKKYEIEVEKNDHCDI